METGGSARQFLIELQTQVKLKINDLDEEVRIFTACKEAQRVCLNEVYNNIEKHFKEAHGWGEEEIEG